MSTESEATPELFVQHARGLRAVARGLLADDATADDVVQETWRMAIERPPHDGRGLGAWLRQVARRTALKHRRGESRRARREQSYARPERLASTVEVLADREILRRVVDAVLTLSEPYQTALVLRFYEDLPPREIARRTGVTVATVKSRIQRGLALARKDLDQSPGGREHWAPALIAATGLMPSAAAVAVAHGGWSMQWKLFAAATSTSVVALCVTSWSAPAESAEGEGGVGESTVVGLVDGATVKPADEVGSQDSPRTAVDPESASAPWADSHPLGRFELTLAGVVRGTRDVPFSASHVYIATPLGPWNDIGEVDDDGRFEVTIRAHEPTQDVLVWASKSSHQGSSAQLVRLQAGTSSFVSLRVEQALEWQAVGMQLDRLKAELAMVEDAGRKDLLPELVEAKRSVEYMIPVRLGVRPRFHFLDGRFQWPTLDSLRSRRLPSSEVVAAGSQRRMQELQLEYERRDREVAARGVFVEETVGVQLDDVTNGVRDISIEGRVVDAAGEPVGEAWLRVDADGNESWWQTRPDGSFHLPISFESDSQIELRAGGQNHGLAYRTIDTEGLEIGATVAWNPVLDRGAELRGTLVFGADVDPDYADATWIVEYRSNAAEPWIDEAFVQDGTFAIPNLPAGSGQLALKAQGGAFPLYVVHDVGPSAGSLTLEVEAADLATGVLEVLAEDESGELGTNPEVRLTQLDTGLSTSIGRTRSRFLERLPIGRYQVTVGDHERGFVDGGVVQIMAGELAEVRVTLAAPGQVDLTKVAGSTSGLVWALYQSDVVDMQVATGMVGQSFEDSIPAGSYVLAVEAPEFAAARVAFEVVAGQVAVPELALDALHELRFANVQPETTLSVVATQGGAELWQGALSTSTARLAVPAGSYRVQSLGSDALPAVNVTTRGDGPTVVAPVGD